MVTFTKFGSCVTSDIFNFMNISDYYPKHTHTGINIGTVVLWYINLRYQY